MKASRYNHFVEFSDNQTIAYNALSNAVALIDNEKMEAYYHFEKFGGEIKDDLLRDELLRCAFLVNDDMNELEYIRYKMLKSRYATNRLTLAIVPTMDCNFRCVYCYQKNTHNCAYMTEVVETAVVEFVDSYKRRIDRLHIVWYGGEPLLALPTISRISEKLISICEKNDIDYSALVITNGYLLTREALAMLNRAKVRSLQITIDGNPEQHDKKRYLADGSKTFERIMNNLREGYDLLTHISLRINTDNDNMSAGGEVCQYLKEYDVSNKIYPYLARVRSDNDCYDEEKCIKECDFAKIEFDFALECKELDSNYAILLPRIKTSYCCADRVSDFIVGPGGELYKCYPDVGNAKKVVGNLLNTYDNWNNVILEYMLYDPTQNMPCRDCKILPICMGGCPLQRITHGKPQCSNSMYTLKRCLKIAVDELLSRQHSDRLTK